MFPLQSTWSRPLPKLRHRTPKPGNLPTRFSEEPLLIRRSSVRARRGPPGDFAGTFVLLRGLRSVSYPPELPRGACHVDVESGTLNPQVVVTNAAGLTIGLRTSDGLVEPFAPY